MLYASGGNMKSKAIFSTSISKIHASGESFRIYEWTGGGPPYIHVHFEDDEAWHMLEGTMTFKLDNGEVEVSAGETMFIPAGTAHTFYEAYGPTRYLMILTPRLDELISELHLTPFEQHGRIMEKYRSKILDGGI
jgi:mannose-6-phosphate isomerase-like protein (cupin superfamily)